MKACVEYRHLREASELRVHALLKLWRDNGWDVAAVFYLTPEEFEQFKQLDLKEIEFAERQDEPTTVPPSS